MTLHKRDLAQNLAQSLTLGAWSKPTLETTLRRRLPSPSHRVIAKLAHDLLEALPAAYAPTQRKVAGALLYQLPFDLIHRYCRRHNISPSPDMTPPAMAPIDRFAQLDLPQLATPADLADWLLLPLTRLDYLADPRNRYEDHGETAINHYHYNLRPKKRDGIRLIEAPKQTLKVMQRQILRQIIDKIPSHPDAFGFTQGRNCLMGASRHASEALVICFDLQDFFPSIGAGRVFGLFRCLGYPHAVAHLLTALCTTKTPHRVLARMPYATRSLYALPHLPQGAPTSPALANLVAFTLDLRLAALARSLGANYSRYADDLSFSGDRRITQALLGTVPEVIRDAGFSCNHAKTRRQPETARQTVTGIVVNAHLNVSRDSFDRLKAIIHACAKPDDTRLADAEFRAHLLGRIGWVENVNPRKGEKLRRLLDAAAH